MGTSVSPCLEDAMRRREPLLYEVVVGRGLHSFTLELNLSNSRTHS